VKKELIIEVYVMNANEMFLLIESYMQHNNFAYNLYIAYVSLYESNKSHNNLISKASGFFTMTQYALNKCMLLEFAKLYCGSGDERTIYKLIKMVEANLHLFNTKDTSILCDNAKKYMETILSPIIEKLKRRRNEDLAHNDKKFFDGIINPALESYISCDDIDALYKFTHEFLSCLIEALPTEKKVCLHTGADDFKSFIEEFDNMLINASNTCDKK
jgi:hypothetical protein